jgi:hypothetical protein
MRRLTEFRQKLPSRYKAAFISLSLPSILEPLVLLDILPLRLLDSAVGNTTASTSTSSSTPTPVATVAAASTTKKDSSYFGSSFPSITNDTTMSTTVTSAPVPKSVSALALAPAPQAFSLSDRPWHASLADFSTSDPATDADEYGNGNGSSNGNNYREEGSGDANLLPKVMSTAVVHT